MCRCSFEFYLDENQRVFPVSMSTYVQFGCWIRLFTLLELICAVTPVDGQPINVYLSKPFEIISITEWI